MLPANVLARLLLLFAVLTQAWPGSIVQENASNVSFILPAGKQSARVTSK